MCDGHGGGEDGKVTANTSSAALRSLLLLQAMVSEMLLWGSSSRLEADAWHSWRYCTVKMLNMELRGLAQV